MSYRSDNRIAIRENECYVSQPYVGYAIDGRSTEEITIVGVLIQTHAFFKTFLHVLSANTELFSFFLGPQVNECSETYLHIKFDDPFPVRCLLELMILEYANPRENTQDILRSLTLALLM